MATSGARGNLYSGVAIGQYLYTLQYNESISSTNYRKFTRHKLGVSESTALTFPPEFGAIYGTGNSIFLFPNGQNKTTYYVYDISDGTWTSKKSNIPFSVNYKRNGDTYPRKWWR